MGLPFEICVIWMLLCYHLQNILEGENGDSSLSLGHDESCECELFIIHSCNILILNYINYVFFLVYAICHKCQFHLGVHLNPISKVSCPFVL
jgi:hypothetical protein